MEENKKCEGGMCGCGKCGMGGGMGMCGYGHMHKHKILKKFFLLVLMIVIFCFGVQLGELRTLARQMRYNEAMMQNYNNTYGGDMMPQ